MASQGKEPFRLIGPAQLEIVAQNKHFLKDKYNLLTFNFIFFEYCYYLEMF